MKTKLMTTAIILMISISNTFSQREIFYWDYLDMTRDSIENIMNKIYDTVIASEFYDTTSTSKSIFYWGYYRNDTTGDTTLAKIIVVYNCITNKVRAIHFSYPYWYVKDIIVSTSKFFKRVAFENGDQVEHVASTVSYIWLRKEKTKKGTKYIDATMSCYEKTVMMSFYLCSKEEYKKTFRMQFKGF